MEDFGWLIFLAVIWVFSTIGEIGKQRSKNRRERRRLEEEEDRPATGPAAGQRDLSRDVSEGARRAEEALRRWEARQQPAPARTETGKPAPRQRRVRVHDPEKVRLRRKRELAGRRGAEVEARREARDERREAYEAIAGMLAGRPAETVQETEIGGAAEIGSSELTPRRLPPSETPRATRAPSAGSRPAAGPAGLARLDRLPLLQRAVVLRELLGPPRALSPESDLP